MPSFKRPDLPPGALKELIDALHALHLEAGHPSARTLEEDLETAAVSHTTIHKVFTTGRLPRWGVVDVLAEALAKRAGRDKSVEVERIRGLWTRAAEEKVNPNPSLKLSENTENPEVVVTGFTSSLSMVLIPALEEIESFGTKKAIEDYRVPTGFDELDALIGGWSPGTLIVVGGRPSSGKTSLMLKFSTAASYDHMIPSMFASVEEGSRLLTLRICSSIARIPLHFLRTGLLSDDDWRRLANRMEKIADAPISFNTTPGSSLDEVAADIDFYVGRFGLRVAFIDGLLSYIDRDSHDNSLEVEAALRKLKNLARQRDITIIVTVPTSRTDNPLAEIDTRLLPESTVIERVADVVIILDRPDQDDHESPRAGEVDLCVVKNRYGPESTVLVGWQARYTRFIDMSANEYPIFRPGKTGDSTSESK
jgi:hypothetical protein